MAKTETVETGEVMEPGTDLVQINTPEEAIEAIRGNLVVKVEDPAVVANQIMERILESDSVDSILGSNIATHAQDVIGRGFTLTGVRYLKSRFDQGLPVFAVMDATFLDNGASAAVTCSARNVCAQAAALWKVGALPTDVVIRRAENPTGDGYFPLWLERA